MMDYHGYDDNDNDNDNDYNDDDDDDDDDDDVISPPLAFRPSGWPGEQTPWSSDRLG